MGFNLSDLLTVSGMSAGLSLLIGTLGLKKRMSSLALNIITIVCAIIISVAAYWFYGKLAVKEDWISAFITGLLGALQATGLYEYQKHMRDKK